MEAEKMTGLLQTAVEETFMTTFNACPDILYFDKFNEMEEECVISSIGFTGTLEGSCAICLPDSSACRIVSRMLDQEITEVSADIIDGIGEITNIVLGSLKMKVQSNDFDFTISVPSYIKGSRMVILSDIKKTVTIHRNYKLDDIVFAISLMYKVKPKEDNAAAKKRMAFDMLKNLGKK